MASLQNGTNGLSKRPVRVANCSGAKSDPGIHMLNQALYGDCDVITGDYLAEINLAENAEKYAFGSHPGWEPTALEGLTMSLPVLNEKRIKVVINGGSLNPQGLAEKIQALVEEKNLSLKVAWVSGDNLLPNATELLRNHMEHLDAVNPKVKPEQDTDNFLDDPNKPLVSCNAYLGARAITKGLQEGADIIICGRVSDASPVIGAAQWWHGWSDIAYDELAGALIAGHLIECSTYVTGANFSGFYTYETSQLLNLTLPIVEITSTGECVVTKAKNGNGYVTTDTVKCQLLYELQGDIYLNSCVKADISHISIEKESENRVYVKGVRGFPPPPSTKLAVFYRGGYQAELTVNATGYATAKKYDLVEAQVKDKLQEWKILDKFQKLEFQRVGIPDPNPKSQLACTSYLRIFVQAAEQTTIYMLLKAFMFNGMQHFAGCCSSNDFRTAMPLPYIAYYPGIVEQDTLNEEVHFLGSSPKSFSVGHPPHYEPLAPRRNYGPVNPRALNSFGETVTRPLGDIALSRSGDKGANINIGIFVHTDEEYEWLRCFMTSAQMQAMMGDDWESHFYIERIEFTNLKAVHFVIYGPLGRGVSSSSRLDALGKAFGEFIRAVRVPIPVKFFN